MENIAANELNSVLKGEQMAIKAYERYIQEVKSESLKKEFQSIQDDHKAHASLLAERIQTLGGHPAHGTGFAGAMANAKIAIQNMISKSNDHDILKHAYDGEDKGIAMVEEIVKGDLDGDSQKLVDKILSVDHDHLSKMAHMIASYET